MMNWLTLSPFWPEPIRLVLFLVGIMSFVGLNAAYLVWVERKGAARFQRRPGPLRSVGLACFSPSPTRPSSFPSN